MESASLRNVELLARRFPSQHDRSRCDVGGADGVLSWIIATAHPHLNCVSFDKPAVTEIAQRKMTERGLGDRVRALGNGHSRAGAPRPSPAASLITGAENHEILCSAALELDFRGANTRVRAIKWKFQLVRGR
jgi:hypothetical protein